MFHNFDHVGYQQQYSTIFESKGFKYSKQGSMIIYSWRYTNVAFDVCRFGIALTLLNVS